MDVLVEAAQVTGTILGLDPIQWLIVVGVGCLAYLGTGMYRKIRKK